VRLFFDGGSEVFRKLRTPGPLKLNIKFEAETKSLRPRPKGPEAKAEAEARGYEAEAKILTSRPVWPRGFNISGSTPRTKPITS